MTIIHHVKKCFNDYYSKDSFTELDEDDLGCINDLKIDEFWYWYSAGSYEGDGYILMRKGDLWDDHSCGHCSCYGPTDNIRFNGKPLDEYKKMCSEESIENIKHLWIEAGIYEESGK